MKTININEWPIYRTNTHRILCDMGGPDCDGEFPSNVHRRITLGEFFEAIQQHAREIHHVDVKYGAI